jgi:predicted transcriptional regulator
MELVWALGEATVHTVHDELDARSGRHRAYTTVMTVMGRLATKGLLVRRRVGRSHLYGPALTREAYCAARAAEEVDSMVAAYGDFALAHFAAQVERLDPRRREALRQLAGRE